MEFRKPTLEDKKKLAEYYEDVPYMNCELTFANFYLWAEHYGTKVAEVDGFAVFLSEHDGEMFFAMPIGKGNKKAVIEKIAHWAYTQGQDFHMNCITKQMFEELEEMFPGCFEIIYERDYADYVYSVDKLANLKGKKLHGKRNHIANFKKNNNWVYEPITDENVQECVEMARQWRIQNGCENNIEKDNELCVTLNALEFRKELGLIGGLLRADGRVVAFTLGEKAGGNAFDIHIEKAFADVQGAYPMINQQFVLNNLMDYDYVNREEDVGSEGLRKAKLSYYPDILLEKGYTYLTEKGKEYFYGKRDN